MDKQTKELKNLVDYYEASPVEGDDIIAFGLIIGPDGAEKLEFKKMRFTHTKTGVVVTFWRVPGTDLVMFDFDSKLSHGTAVTNLKDNLIEKVEGACIDCYLGIENSQN